ncbi:hypothetical protein ABZ760_04595 [Streptomyces sp. NPDC006658]|uniref:hypothetical protein n=1 Tax=Streptomyces sp. NPDC006658 TaxID=3156900 RepID=UPI0033EB96C5
MPADRENVAGAGDAGERAEHGAPRDHGVDGEERGEYGGMDALMAAITGEPLPARAHRDPAFLAAHRAAETDVAALRDGLARLAEALTGEERREETASGERTREERPGGERTTRAAAARPAAPGNAVTGDPVTGDPVISALRRRGRIRTAGGASAGRSAGPGGARRGLRAGVGAVAGVAAFSLLLGFGWLAGQGGGMDGGGSSAKSDTAAGSREAAGDGRPAESRRELACARLVVEGTVARVERRPEAPGSRVTLTVTRSYKPARGPAGVVVLLDADARPAPRAGQHVLAGVARGEEYASLWAVGDTRVAAERARITEALPGSRGLSCPGRDD